MLQDKWMLPPSGLQAVQSSTHSRGCGPQTGGRQLIWVWPWRDPQRDAISWCTAATKTHQSLANRTQTSKIHLQNKELSSACGLNHALCLYFHVWNQVKLIERRAYGKYFKTIAVNSSKRALREKNMSTGRKLCSNIWSARRYFVPAQRLSHKSLSNIWE